MPLRYRQYTVGRGTPISSAHSASVFAPMTSGVARRAVAVGKRYCPHYFGGGISLLASLQVLAAAGGEGLLEFDAHPNLGREAVVGDLLPVRDGSVPVPTGAGLGATPDLARLASHQTLTGRIQA